MHRSTRVAGVILTWCILASCLGAYAMVNDVKETPHVDPARLKAFALETNQFGFDLFQQLRGQAGNLFLSPYSISSAMGMVTIGGRGQTAQQLSKVLHLPESPDRIAELHQGLMASLLNQPKGYDIRIANALWGQEKHPFKDNFINLVQRSFRAEARTMNFISDADNSRSTINRWVEAQTNNRIKDLLQPGTITPDTRLVLTNAIYFKGTWLTPFKKEATRPVEFNLASGEKIKSDMMYRSDHMQYAETDQVQAVELPYQGDRLSMVVLLPLKKDGLTDVESRLSAEFLNSLLTQRKSVKVNLTLPKIKTAYTAGLNKALSDMGVTDAFDSSKANFSGIDGTSDLFISIVIHKAFCEVNEEGTEAAAATGVVMEKTAAPVRQPLPIEFKADHPYLYLIRDTQTGCLLFLGRVADPRQ